MTDVCRSCSAKIRWAITAGGHPMPLDYDPVEDGNLRLDPPTNGETPRVTIVPAKYRVAGEELYKSHFATCVYADRHRKRMPK
jgi:hypothetical protein